MAKERYIMIIEETWYTDLSVEITSYNFDDLKIVRKKVLESFEEIKEMKYD